MPSLWQRIRLASLPSAPKVIEVRSTLSALNELDESSATTILPSVFAQILVTPGWRGRMSMLTCCSPPDVGGGVVTTGGSGGVSVGGVSTGGGVSAGGVVTPAMVSVELPLAVFGSAFVEPVTTPPSANRCMLCIPVPTTPTK